MFSGSGPTGHAQVDHDLEIPLLHQKLFIWSQNCYSQFSSRNKIPSWAHRYKSLKVHVLILVVPAVAHGQVHVLPLHAHPLPNVQGVLINVDTSHFKKFQVIYG